MLTFNEDKYFTYKGQLRGHKVVPAKLKPEELRSHKVVPGKEKLEELRGHKVIPVKLNWRSYDVTKSYQ